jgi:hypothetical protein
MACRDDFGRFASFFSPLLVLYGRKRTRTSVLRVIWFTLSGYIISIHLVSIAHVMLSTSVKLVLIRGRRRFRKVGLATCSPHSDRCCGYGMTYHDESAGSLRAGYTANVDLRGDVRGSIALYVLCSFKWI